MRVSLWNKRIHYIKQQKKPLPKGVVKKLYGLLNELKEMPACTYVKASYTLEATVIIPIVVGFWMFIMLFFRVLQVQTEVAQALDYAGRMVAVESSEIESRGALLVTAKGILTSELRNYELVDKYVQGGKLGVTLTNSDFSRNNIELIAQYKIKVPIRFFNLGSINIEQHSYHRKWIGKEIISEEDRYVYYTDYGEVYHLSSSCNFLDLSIHSEKYSDLAGLRNRNAHKYSACTCAVANNNNNSTVYVTDYGTKYHKRLNCRGLKRTVHMVKLSEVGNRRLCTKCRLNGEANQNVEVSNVN